MMASPFDMYAIIQVLSVIFQSLILVLSLTGLIWSLLWLRDAGLSAKLAAMAFGLQVLVQIGSFAQDYLFSSSGWTFYTPYSTESDSSVWLSIGWFALLFSLQLLSAGLGLAALIVAWRRIRSLLRSVA